MAGAGGHGQVVADILRTQARTGENVEFAGFLDDAPGSHGPRVENDIRGSTYDWSSVAHDQVIVAIGDNGVRCRIFDRLERSGARFAVARHPAAVVASGVPVGRGSMICAGVVINPEASIGANTIVNTSASVDHHCAIGNHVHVAPGCHLGGNVRVDDGALVGVGAVVLPGIRIGRWALVGGGAVVTADVPQGAVVAGVPARVLRMRSLISIAAEAASLR